MGGCWTASAKSVGDLLARVAGIRTVQQLDVEALP